MLLLISIRIIEKNKGMSLINSCLVFLFYPAMSSGAFYDFHENAFLAVFTSEHWMKPYMRVIVLITCVHILIVLLMEPYKEVLKRDAAVEFREVCKQNVCMLICVITF